MKTNSSPVWGGRFKKPLAQKTVKFNESISFDKKLAQFDILGSQAHAEMLAKQGIISEFESHAIINGLKKISKKINSNKIEFSEEAEDIHMNIELFLIKEIGDTAKKLHTGRSRNDQVALDLRLYVKHEIQNIQNLLNNLNISIEHIAYFHKETILPGYTHLQKAQPITLEKYLKAYQSMFLRDTTRLNDCLVRMDYSPLGAGALAGTSLPIDREFTAKKLGFNGVIENSIDAVSDRDFIIEFISAASIIITHLSRFSEDMIIWATEEFNFIKLDDAYATGSSLMPNKKNPDIPELIRGKTGRIFGNLMGILTVMKALPLGYNKDLQEDKEGLFDTVETIKNCLDIFNDFLNSITFQTDNMKISATNSYIWSTHLLEQLVKQGIAFRIAHEIIGNLVIYCLDNNKYFSQLTKEECDKISPHIFSSIKLIH
ncbi:argininosuccinate lyase [Fluviispira multicolorata]|uniref:Argininosuccinate lyase n=1 Tax=Fluviispira multicolorata TaxID=2654512 RepID=A0A833JDA2_9BACT|nr:argininosuccinate lyase [Fluviispira multicolorata]KAB8031755.1 argininosuccinate lyase [Fluviispira multicolorata]